MFSLANMTGVNLEGARFELCDFQMAKLGKAKAAQTSWQDCNLERLDAPNTDFAGAQFKCCELSKANVQASDFSHATFTASILFGLIENETCWEDTVFDNSPKLDLPRAKAEQWSAPTQ
jgi:uncharacterized protein YjbI with pentapeptide repeats